MKARDSIWEISVYSFVVRRSRVLCPGEQVAAAGRDALHLRLCVLTGAEGAVEGLPRIGDYGHAVVLRRACTPRARRSHQASALERRDVGSSAPGLYSMQVPSGPGRRGMPVNTLAEARILIEWWRKEYNQVRPHSALGYRPPAPQTIMPAMA